MHSGMFKRSRDDSGSGASGCAGDTGAGGKRCGFGWNGVSARGGYGDGWNDIR